MEFAEGQLEEAVGLLKRVEDIRVKAGDAMATMLALCYLQMGRVYFLSGDTPDSLRMLGKSEALFVRTVGQSKHFMAQ